MYGYNKAENEFGAVLANQGLPVVSVTKVGRTFHVKLTADASPDAVAAANLGKRNLRLLRTGTGRDLRSGQTVMTAEFAPGV